MTDPTIERCAAAIAEVRERYIPFAEIRKSDDGFWMDGVWDNTDRLYVAYGTHEHCQAWIDEQAARACVAALPHDVEDNDDIHHTVMSVSGPFGRASFANEFTAAITAILEGKA